MKRKMYAELREALRIDVSSCKEAENGFYGQDIGKRTEGEFKTQANKEQLLIFVRNTQSIKRPKKRIGFFEFMIRQIPFMGRDLWMTQGTAALAMFGILYLTMDGDLEVLSIRHIPLLIGILAVILVMASVPLMLMPYRYHMDEIELISWISLPRLLTAKMMLLAMEYAAVLGFSVGLTAGIDKVLPFRVTLYFIIPLLVACTGCVQIIRYTDGWEEASQRIGVCEGYCACIAAALVALYGMKPVIYDNVRLWTLLMVCIVPLFIRSIRMWVSECKEIGERFT